MRIFISLIVITTCFGSSFSQNRFYLQPCVETYFGFSYIASFDHKQLTPSYFDFKLKRVVWLPKANAGLMAGYQFNKSRTCINAGILQAGATSGIELSFNEFSYENNTYKKTSLPVKGRTQGFKIPVLLSTQISYIDSLKFNRSQSFSLHFNLVCGVNFYHQNYNSIMGPLTIQQATYRLSPTQEINASIRTHGFSARKKLILQLGFSVEVRKNKKELASLSFCWLPRISKRSLVAEELYITITDTLSGKKESYWNHAGSAGQGMIITLSKRIFVH